MNSNNYLKYWRVISYYFRKKYNLKVTELETLLFLKSEVYFRKTLLVKYSQITSWNNKDFNTLFEKGFIQLFRTGGPKKNIYELSIKAKRMLTEMYEVLNGNELSVRGTNRFTKNNILHRDAEYLNMIKRMNESIRQQQRQAHE